VDLPGRHGASISEPIPSVEGWDGSIAYLDRDGVLNVGREDYVKTVDEVDMLQGAGDAVAALRAAGYRIVIVTNQSPINREVFTHEDLAEMNEAVINGLLEQNPSAEVDLILYSHYAPWEHSPVRKPAPGMLQVGRQLLSGLELEVTRDSSELSNRFDEGRSFMAGDRDADMGAAWHHGVRAFRVDAAEGIAGIIDRLLDDDDEGDEEAEDEAVNAGSDLDTGNAYEGKVAKATGPISSTEQMREYVEKVNAVMGDNGDNTKSPVAGKNDMGGDAKNIATGGEGTGGSNTGLSGNNAKEDSAGNVNVPGGKASKSLKSDSKGHGTEKKGKGEEGGTNTGSVIGS